MVRTSLAFAFFRLRWIAGRFSRLETMVVNQAAAFLSLALSRIRPSRKPASPPSHQSSVSLPPKFRVASVGRLPSRFFSLRSVPAVAAALDS